MEHDTSYKLLFSHPEMVRDLLLGFVPGEWVKDADFSSLEHVNGSYVSESGRQRHDDIVWRLKIQDRWLWVYLILEFQSEPDSWMAVRMMVYVGLLAQHLIREGQLHDGDLPPILPVVLYNGLLEWRYPKDVSECFVPPPKGLEAFRPQLLYHLVDEMRLKLHPMESVRNFSGALFQLEQGRSVEDVRRMLQALDGMLRAPELQSLRRSFGVWVRGLLRREAPRSSIDDIGRINDIVEAERMLGERRGWFDEAERKGLERGLEQGLEQGRAEGLKAGEKRALRNLLTRRFGALPTDIEGRIERASLEQLEGWFDRGIEAPSLQEIFGHGG